MAGETKKVGGGRAAVIDGRTIELAEVEQTLQSHSAVFDARVEDAGDGRLRAEISLKGGYQASNDLKTELAWVLGSDLGFSPVFEDILFRARDASVPALRSERREEGDAIFTSGHRIDLSEVERVLETYDDVTRAVVTGVPDSRRGEILKAWVSLRTGSVPTDELKAELAWFAQVEIGPMVRFEDIEFGEAPDGGALPKGLEGMVVVDEVTEEGGETKVAGHRISTTEVTRVLLSHPDISDAAVVTVPDAEKGEVMKAFAKVRDGVVPTNDLKLELAWLVLTELKPVGLFKSIELDGAQARTAGWDAQAEDLATISGQTVLSIDVEEALERHPAVAEAVVIAVPDKTHGEALQAFVNLSTGTLPTEDLREELAWHTRALVGEQVVFKSVKFRRFLPGAKDRKAMRRILRADALEIPTNVSITIAD
jgi:acyl-coenzyme A synthetase/AMP-(fatty) acid ligase